MNALDVVAPMAAIVSIGVMIDSAELLSRRAALSSTGLYSWDVLSLGRHYLVKGPFSRPLGGLFRYPQVLALPLIQLLLAPFLLASPFLPKELAAPLIAVGALCIAAARMLFYMRQQLGLDGADQMMVIVLVSAGFGALFGNTMAGTASVDYAALQLLLSYAVAGAAKAVSPVWRSGRAITGITGTIGYGSARFHQLVERFPILAKLICWSVIAFECSAAPLILLGVKGAWIIIAGGLLFHIGIAAVMGLNLFVWAFAACYPALIFFGTQVEHWLGR